MGPFDVLKVARLYGQQVIIEDPDWPGGLSRQMWAHIIHASRLVPFDERYVKP